jgi:hypothetical protein
MSFEYRKTARRKGIHTMPMTKIPKAPKVGGMIKTPSFPKLPKLPTTHVNKGRY